MTDVLAAPPADAAAGDAPEHHAVLVVGSGFGGIGAAVKLLEAGHDDLVVLERGQQVGGTWRDNTYPGCACDVPTALYSFSFAPNPDWSRTFGPQAEIQRYLLRVADERGVTARTRFGHDLRDATWDEAEQRWRVTTSAGAFTCDVLVMATGALSQPSVPQLPGLERFEGTVFHSAQWDHDHDLAGERVAVVGTGASAIQFVPAIQPTVARLHLFQRTAPWVLPRRDREIPAWRRRLYRTVPAAQRAARALTYWPREVGLLAFTRRPQLLDAAAKQGRANIAKSITDPALRDLLTPRFQPGCKRVLLSDDYYPALAQPNVEVLGTGVVEVRERSVVGADGSEREVDTIIFGTGFKVTDNPVWGLVHGRDGRSLADQVDAAEGAYAGSEVAGFPNLFLLAGPNTGIGHTSLVYMIEAQLALLVGALEHLRTTGAATFEPTLEAQRAWDEEVQRKMVGTVWTAGGCDSWYLDRHGRNLTLWPDFTFRFKRRTRRFDPAAHRVEPRRARVSA